MSRTETKYLIDLGLAVSFLVCFITGVIKYPGFLRFLEITPRSLPMFQITQIHDRSGLILGVLVLMHIALNWGWIVAVTKKILR